MSTAADDPFGEARLLQSARKAAGLEDFGPEPFVEPMQVQLDSLRAAPLNDLGVMILRGMLLRSLIQRLRTQHWCTEHPEILDERIDAPIVVVGMMRSGTTLLQRVLAADPRFACAHGWEVGEPAPRPGWDPAAPDPRIPDAEAREGQTRTFAAEIFAIHPTYVHEAEEEIVFLADAFLSHVPEASCNVPRYRSWIDGQDFAPAYRWLRRMLQLLQWQKRRRGEPVRPFVLKTPAHLGYLDVLIAEFPDAHIVHAHRDPVDVIPSGASLNTTLWRTHCDDVDPHEVGRQWIERMGWSCDRALTCATTSRPRRSPTSRSRNRSPSRSGPRARARRRRSRPRRRHRRGHGGLDRPGPQARVAGDPPLHGRGLRAHPGADPRAVRRLHRAVSLSARGCPDA